MKRLFIDLDICNKCKTCKACCDYFYHPQNNGVASLREYASFATICRHCEDAPCVTSCYRNALGRASDGHIKRSKMRCTSCKSCSLACPFGVIFQDFIPYLDSRCGYCLDKIGQLPKCLTSCPMKGVDILEIEENAQEDIYFVGQSLAVHSRRWLRQDAQNSQKINNK